VENKNIENWEILAHKGIFTIIFRQLSPEKPNEEKPVQQIRVLLLFFNNFEYNNLDVQLAIKSGENIGKIIVRIFSHPTANFYL